MHSCTKPVKPAIISNQKVVDEYNAEIKKYEQCIEAFVAEQNQAAKNHQQAAEQAVADWNDYVSKELQ